MRMTPIDWNNRDPRGGSWGRFGEPEQPYSTQVDSLKLPRRFGELEQPYSPKVDSLKIPKRRGSFDDSSNININNSNSNNTNNNDNTTSNEEEEKLQGDKSTNNTRCSSPNTMLGPSNVGRVRQSRFRRRSFRRPSFEIPTIEGSNSNSNSDFDEDDDYLCRRAAQQHLQQQQQQQPAPRQGLDAPTAPIRRASTGTRDLANSVFGTAQALLDEKPRRVSISGPRPCMESTLSLDAPIRRRSLGGTRPCMENTSNCDGPILRPYRQLSSDDLCVDMGCIGEETDEDLRSNRSNRSCLVDFSNRSNRSCLEDFSKRSNRMVDFSNRSNRSCFREFSTRSRTGVPEALDTTATSAPTTSPVHEEPSESSASPLPAEPASPHEGPEPWPVKPNRIMSIEDNPALSRSKTWPTNLMILLSIKKLSLKEEDLDSDDEDSSEDDCCYNEENGLYDEIVVAGEDGNQQLRRKGKSNSPYRSKNTRRLLRTIHKASEVMEGEKPRTVSITNNF